LKKFLFADLDDSLFQSLEKCHEADDLQPAAFLKDGSPISFTTARQRAFLAMAHDGMTIIPATARNLNAFLRVKLNFSSYAVLNYGGIVMAPDGAVDAAWLQSMRGDMERALPGLQDVVRVMDDYAQSVGFAGRSRLIEDFSTPFYVVIKDPGKVPARLEQIEREVVTPWIATAGKEYFVHRNGNNLAILPKALNKARAVRYLAERLKQEHGEILTFGMGDSKSDATFMAACDYAIVPRGTQLAGLTLETL
jgi:hypothetical protein